mmetsp:Transcript_31905/g.67077  ORF Transcript_31905/g.67077 Transcript_31905/m.67077 type:complete len:801 (+) Transcript_31905:169-2571(+)|eukprot:CAMPEP_0172315256 /NCGR_PEP_ID=MMETSP1058-20130122/24612_1 /TAXON_ID=83371 /ORGANISM="Detonula confervacea, Strain CCMP 353" /LENGTH=800 /DNA_ID=CAMNT_0013029303 /DNA_START=163 /DNA_END=2565 /DNA_ORIENTATION=-
MKKAALFASAALPLLIDVAADHPAMPGLHPKFRSHLKCPYADKWLAKGPEQAALELGLDQHGRKLQSTTMEQLVQGSCSFANAFSGEMTCMQFQGTGWTADDITARCAQESGSLSAEGCTDDAAGWCDKKISDGKHEATAMVLSAMADCSGSKMACETFLSGSFIAAGECLTTAEETGNIFGEGTVSGPPPGVATGEATSGGSWPGAAPTGGDDSAMKCLLAPGAIGAAHQAGWSKGYSASCPGTPAQESPYIWPLSWAADYESNRMAYGSDDVVYTDKGRTFYMLDKNWKRSDTIYQNGFLRTIGQGPCEDIDEDFAADGFLGCHKNMTDGTMSTMIHRGNLMYFISWKNETDVQPGETDPSKIGECTMSNLAVIGNIRPDWFMDKRGDDTDTQYLGDQHAYYGEGGITKLVKQWRKKDFANQYFVMSMMGNPPNKLKQDPDAPIEDNMHWPMILNIPGEGFGDDSLQVYKNHKLLTDEDEDLFKLIENYEAIGGVCVSLGAAGGGDIGPPVLDEEESIPSNLEVDPLSWMTNEITFSPIWEVPTKVVGSESTMSAPATSGKSVLEVSNRMTVESCYDEATKMMDMSIHFHDVEPGTDGLLPWMAVGYRASDVCAMTPPEGGTTPIVLVTQASEDAAPQAHKTTLLPEAKGMSQVAFDSMITLMRPLEGIDEYTNVSVEAPMASTVVQMARSASTLAAEDTVSLHFKQAVDENPEVMNLLYAIGMTSELGFHTTRGCFEVQATPCGNAGSVDAEGITIDLGEQKEAHAPLAATAKSSANAASAGVMFAISTVFAIMIGN